MVDFEGSYHAILRRLCYAMFMAVTNYTYLKLRMLGPNDVITVSYFFKQAYAYSRQHFELATSITNSAELKSLHETTVEIAPEHNEPTLSNAFRSAEETKVIGVDSNNPTKTVRIGT